MLRRVLAPLHPDGFKFVAIGAVLATLLLFLLWAPAGWVACDRDLVDGLFLPRPVAGDPDAGRACWSARPTGSSCRSPRQSRPRTGDGRHAGCPDRHLSQHLRRACRRARRSAAGSRRCATPRAVSSMPASTRRARTTSGWRSASPRRKAPRSPLCWSPGSSRGASSAICYRGPAGCEPASGSASSASARGSTSIARRLMCRWSWSGSAWSAAKPCSPTGSPQEPPRQGVAQ